MKIGIAEHKYIIEKEYEGYRCLAHKSGGEVKLFSESKDVFELDFLSPKIMELSNRKFLVDGIIVAYNGKDPLGKAAVLNIIKDNKVPPSVTLKYHIFDMVYYDGVDISNFPLHKRKALLTHLNFNNTIKNVFSLIVTNKQDLEKSTKLFCSMSGSKGAIIKEYGSTYTLNDWFKYSRDISINAVVLESHSLGANYYFTVGIPVSKSVETLRPGYLLAFNEKPHLILGKTKSSKTQRAPGDLIELNVEEVCKHEWYNNGALEHIRFSLTGISSPLNSDRDPSSLDYMHKLSSKNIIENMELSLDDSNPGPEGGTISSLALEFWKDGWHKMYPPNGEGKFIFQQHWQQLTKGDLNLNHNQLLSESKGVLHGDLRFSATHDAWAFTIFEGSVKDIPKEEGSRFIAMSQNKESRLQAHPKARIELNWLDKGEITPELPSNEKMFARDWGSYKAGTWRENMIEVFLDGESLSGRMILSRTKIGNAHRWLVSFPKDQTPYAVMNSKEKVISEMRSCGEKHLIWNNELISL